MGDGQDPEQNVPPRRIRVVGRAVNDLVVRAPWLWPVIRPATRRFFDNSARGWDERTDAPSAQHLASLAAGLTYVKPHPERALEIGTGTGVGALLIAREFPRVSVRGIDISEEMIREAQSKVGLDPEGRVAFRVADAADLPYDADSFDLVAQINMPPFFAEAARVLRPGGSIVISSSSGSLTPFYTPNAVLARGFRKRGIEPVQVGEIGRGTFYVGRSAT